MIVNPGIRRFLGSAIQRLFNGASFSAPLTHTLVPERGTGSPTFTRASTATFDDWEGVLRTVPSGCARFEGARMVRNYITKPENLADASWTNSTMTVSSGVSDPNGGTTAFTLTAAAANAYVYSFPVGSAGGYINSVYIRRRTGTGTIRLRNPNNLNPATHPAVTSSWQRFNSEVTDVYSGTGPICVILIETSGDAIDVWHPQTENITGRTDQTTPSEYVSVGVESAPYHGAGVDGVEYFDTDLSGNPIAAATNTGYLAEGSRENKCLQANALTTTWVAVGTPAATQNAVGPDGGTTAWTLTDNNAGATEGVAQVLGALTAASYTMSAFIKKTTGATVYPLLEAYDGIALKVANATIDTNNGVATAWTAYNALTNVTTAATCVSYNANYWRVSMTFTATTNSWTVYLFPAGTTNATQSTGVVDASVQGSAVFYGAQVELGANASSYIPTTTIAVTRAADILTYSGGDTANLKTLCATFRRAVGVSVAGNVLAISDNTANEYQSVGLTSATAVRFDGVDGGAAQWQTTASNAYTPAASSTAAWSAATNDVKMALDGTGQTADTTATMPTVTQLHVGHLNGTLQLNGTTRDVYGWTRNLSQSELNAIT
jgi:hypothetical protein